jgi:hypothetical protein
MDPEDLSSFSPEPTFGLGGHTCLPIFAPVLRSVLLLFFLNKTITADVAHLMFFFLLLVIEQVGEACV